MQAAFAGDADVAPIAVTPRPSAPPQRVATRPFSHAALGFAAGSQGVGVQMVTTISSHSNLRLDGQYLGFSADLKQSGVGYNANLRMGSVRLSYDVYPFRNGFRLSSGLALFNQFNARALASVPGGSTITFNDVDYYSSTKDPLHGVGRIGLSRKVAPTLSMGWGNAIPRNRRHFSFPVEIGVAFVGTPKFDLTMTGSACSTPNPHTCAKVVSYAEFDKNLKIERDKINRDLRPLRFYPIANFGATYRF